MGSLLMVIGSGSAVMGSFVDGQQLCERHTGSAAQSWAV
jgi:hypothetical protein